MLTFYFFLESISLLYENAEQVCCHILKNILVTLGIAV